MPNLVIVNVDIAPNGACVARSSDPAGLVVTAADFDTLIAALPAQAAAVWGFDTTSWGDNPNQWQLEVRTRVSGASSDANVPAWVPAGAKIHIDFLGGTPQGRAWVDATGEVGIETLIGEDPNAAAGGGSSTDYDPDYLYDIGYNPGADSCALGALRNRLMAGATMVVRFAYSDVVEVLAIRVVAANGTNGIEYTLVNDPNEAGTQAYTGTMYESIADCVNIGGRGTVNACALTLTATRSELAVNGSAAVAGVLTAAERPGANPLVACLFKYGVSHLQSITAYDPLPTTAGLSALST